MLTYYIYKWLDSALDFGIKEHEFWDMTIAEFSRAIKSKEKVKRIEAQEKASFDYILADLIGRSIGRVYSSATHYPDISAVYPSLFDSEEIKQMKADKQAELSVLRFKQFASFHNSKYNGGGN